MRYLLVLLATACLCIEWTRIAGTVKVINLRDSTVTLQNRDGDLLTVPVDYQVKITEKHGELRDLKHLALDERITLTRIVAPKEDPDYPKEP